LITFDDGYAGIFKNALPVLQEMGLPSTIFMNMSPVLGGEFWAERVAYLCNKDEGFQRFLQDQLGSQVSHTILHCTEELVDLYHQETGIDYLTSLPGYVAKYVSETDLEVSGGDSLVTLGNHSYVHYNVKNLSDEALKEQYEKNANALSKFKQYLPVFAFPFGHRGLCFSPDQASYLLKMGAARLFTAWPQPNPDPTARLLDRISLHMHHDTDNRLWFQVLKYPIYQTVGKSPQTFGDNID
jgi:peptidoglycan/xylan/chitin deacetylase (PgdA/CDA1 family)